MHKPPARDYREGIVTVDPTAITTSELRLQFEAILAQTDMKGAREGVGYIDGLRGALVVLSFRDDDGHHTLGSGVMVGPGLALCADHVVRDYLGGFKDGTAALVCQAPTQDEMLLWRVDAIAQFHETDLAVLTMSLASDLPKSGKFATAHLTTRMPANGDELVLCGFTAERATQPLGDVVHIEGDLRMTSGKVIDVYPMGRDRVMLPGPCFAVDCPAFGGMSGGPVFDSRGFLVGVVSVSSDGVETAYVSHLWPALVRGPVMRSWPNGTRREPATLLQLGRKFGVIIERPDAFALAVVQGQLGFDYRPWR